MSVSADDSRTTSNALYSVVLGLSEPAQMRVFTSELGRHGRFEILNKAPNAILTVELASKLQPDVIILSDLSQGTPGRHVLPDLARLAPHAKVIITVADHEAAFDGSETHASVRVIHDHDLDALRTALDSTVGMLDHPEAAVERRKQVERRVAQDWTKVFSERRVEMRRGDEQPQA